MTDMKPYFVVPSIASISYGRDSTLTNDPVNLSNVTHVAKGKYAWYPDNTGLATIEFHFIGKDTPLVRWCFPRKEKRHVVVDRSKNNGYYLASPPHVYRNNFANSVEYVLDTSDRDAEFLRIMALMGVDMPTLKSGFDWIKDPKYKGIEILDADGWRRRDGIDLGHLITEDDFVQRLNESTIKKVKGKAVADR